MKAVLIYSGGMDSFTLLHELLREGHEVYPLSFDYGQRHSKELEYATAECLRLGLPHHIIDLTSIHPLLQGSALTSDIDVPEGHYEEESMKLTVVPNRNMIMLSIAVGYAVSLECSAVYIGAHAGDHAIYPDCRLEFIEKMNDVTTIANYNPVFVHAPYIKYSKGDIAVAGRQMGVDYSRAWTCYKGGDKPCLKCGACQERMEAMAYAGIIDPEYRNDD